MGQLTNQFVSQSYQGLLNLENANTGFTTNLQTVTDGLGGLSPLQISKTQVNISGAFTVNGAPVSFDTGSLVTTSSFNAYTSSMNSFTSSIDGRVDALEIETGSLQNQINTLATTGSLSGYTTITAFNNYTSSNDSKVNSLIASTGSYATTSSLTSLSQSIATTDLNQDNRLTALEGVTGSINRNGLITTGSIGGTQSITGSLDVQGTISATSASFTYVTTVFETASVIYSSGSNQFGDASNDTQTLWGRVAIPTGPVSVTGSVIATNFTGSLQGTASFAVSSSQAQNAVSASQSNNSVLFSGLGPSAYARTNFNNTFTQDQTIDSGSALITNEIISEANERLLILSDGNVGGGGARIIIGDTPTSPGDPLSDTSVSITGSLGVSGGVTSPNFTGLASNSTLFGGRGVAQFILTSSFNAYTSSNDTRVNSLINATSSYVTETESGSFMTTGSVSGNVLTFTKGNGSQFNLTVDTGSVTPINTGSFATTGSNSFNGNQTITGSLITTGSTTLNGTTTLNGNVDVTTGNLNVYSPQARFSGSLVLVTGSVEVSNGITGSLEGTASFATNALSASYAPSNPLPSGLVSGSSQISYTGITDVPSGIVSGSSQISYTGITDVPAGIISGSGQISDLGFATTGSNTFKGDQTITGSLLGSTLNDGQIRIFSDAFNSGAVKMNISSSNPAAQSNIIFGSAIGVAPIQLTGSIVISGSNNIIMGGPRPNTLVTAGTYGYVGGSTNIFGGQSTLNTGSSYRPVMNSNINYGGIIMTLGSGSNNFQINQNALIGGTLVLNMPSASIGGTMTTNIIAGQVNLQQTQPIPLASASFAPAFAVNNVNGTFNLQTNSGSFQVQNNNINGNNVSVTSSYRATTAANNAITFNNNSINGLNHRILFDGVSNQSKGLNNTLIVGANNTASMVGNDNNGISNTGIIGQGLHVENGNISGTGGSLIVGRFNETGSLSNPGDIKFAVGTGNGNTTRRTTLWVDTNSKVGVSGSLDVTGSVNITGSLTVTGSNVNVNGGFTVITGSNVNVRGGSINISGSQLTTNNYVVWNGSPNDAGAMSNFVGAFMVNRNAFVFNNIVQAQLTSGSNFSINTDVGSNVTTQTYSSTWGGTEAKISVQNQNGTRRIDLNADNLYASGALNVGVSNNVGRIQTYGGSQWLYRDGDNNTVVGNANGVGSGFFAGSEKNMIFNGFSTPFATGSNNVIIQGAGDNFISGSGNLFIGSHNGHAGGSKNLLLGATSYSSGSVFDDKFELGTQNSSRIFHKQGTDPLQIGYDTQVTGSLWVNGNKQFNGAQYSSLQTLSGSANVSQSVYFDTTGPQFGVSLVDNTKLTVANPGTYNIQFSAQLEADGGADNVFVWFKKNGTNIAGSASEVKLDNNKENIMTVNILDTAVANDYYEIAWQNTNNNGRLLYQAASGNVPSTPSVITTVTQVR